MSKHTPGPWSVDVHRNVLGPDGKMVAFPCIQDGQNEVANARLIAAAPELLKSLIEILPMAKDSLSHPNLSVEILDAIAAITKATGEYA